MIPHLSAGQGHTEYEYGTRNVQGQPVNYRLLLPEKLEEGKKYPLVVFLHGSGERGNDNEKQLVHGARLFLVDSIRKKYPAFVLFPQCPEESYWSNVIRTIDSQTNKKQFNFIPDGEPTTAMAQLIQLIAIICNEYPVDISRMYAGGLSMGGMGVFELVSRMPGKFAGAFPICGGVHKKRAKRMKNCSWWIFHGAKDDVIEATNSINAARYIKRTGARVKLSIYPDANHNSWDSAFAEKKLIPWLFDQKIHH